MHIAKHLNINVTSALGYPFGKHLLPGPELDPEVWEALNCWVIMGGSGAPSLGHSPYSVPRRKGILSDGYLDI